MNSPNTGIPYVPEGTLDPAAGLNDAIDVIDALLQTGVIRMDLTAPPGSPLDGDLYVPAAPASGAWAGLADYLVRYRTEGAFWQSFAPGLQVKFLLNLDDGNFYKFDATSSPGGWVLAAGLGDAPSDGTLYGRRDATWDPVPDPLSVEDENSPPTVETGVTELIFGDGLSIEVLTGGRVRVTAAALPPPPVVNSSAANVDATAANPGNYTRFSHAGPTYTFDDGEGYDVGAEYHGRYVGSGTLELLEAGGMTLNPPADGTLEIPPGGTFTVKIVAADEADVFGVTVPAP